MIIKPQIQKPQNKFVVCDNSIKMAAIINNINQLDLDGNYSYAYYLLWQFKERVEIIKGKILKMSPAPSLLHQYTSRLLGRQIDWTFVKTTCKMYAAPFDVRLVDYKNSTADNQ